MFRAPHTAKDNLYREQRTSDLWRAAGWTIPGPTERALRFLSSHSKIRIIPMSKFKGKVALVTGGTSGIGLATVSLLRAESAEVIAVGTNSERLASVREIVGSNGLVVEADLRKLNDIDKV